MRRIFAILVASTALAASLHGQSAPPIPEPVDSLVSSYLQTQQALAADDLDSALASADAFAKQLARASYVSGPWNQPALVEAVDGLALAADLESLRSAFRGLSVEMLDLIKQQGPQAHAELLTVECPMAFGNEGARWIQTVDAVANPYFGASMLRCGSIDGRYLAGLGYFTQTELERIHGDMPGFNSSDASGATDQSSACGMSCCAGK